MDKNEKIALEQQIISVLKNVYDPEIPSNIYDLGLIYRIDIEDDGSVEVVMTLTTPNCPVAESLPIEVKQTVEAVEGVRSVDINLTFEPPWSEEMMSEEAMLELGLL